MSVLAGHVLIRTAEILDGVDSPPPRCETTSLVDRVAPRRLSRRGDDRAHGGSTERSTGLVHDNERRWARVHAHVQELVERSHTLRDVKT